MFGSTCPPRAWRSTSDACKLQNQSLVDQGPSGRWKNSTHNPRLHYVIRYRERQPVTNFNEWDRLPACRRLNDTLEDGSPVPRLRLGTQLSRRPLASRASSACDQRSHRPNVSRRCSASDRNKNHGSRCHPWVRAALRGFALPSVGSRCHPWVHLSLNPGPTCTSPVPGLRPLFRGSVWEHTSIQAPPGHHRDSAAANRISPISGRSIAAISRQGGEDFTGIDPFF